MWPAHYTYAELEENEVDLDKLQKWFDRVRERDVFGASGRQAAEKALARVRGVAGGVRRQRLRRGSGEPLSPHLLSAAHGCAGSRVTQAHNNSRVSINQRWLYQ